MKKTINLSIIGLAAFVMVWGIIASCIAVSTANPKTTTSDYAKDGRIIVSYEVSDSEKYLLVYVKNATDEIITPSEYYQRIAKNRKIHMNKARETYLADKSDENLYLYNEASTNYEKAKNTSRAFDNRLFTTGTETFFGTYCPIIILLGIAFLINTKVDYKRDKNKPV